MYRKKKAAAGVIEEKQWLAAAASAIEESNNENHVHCDDESSEGEGGGLDAPTMPRYYCAPITRSRPGIPLIPNPPCHSGDRCLSALVTYMRILPIIVRCDAVLLYAVNILTIILMPHCSIACSSPLAVLFIIVRASRNIGEEGERKSKKARYVRLVAKLKSVWLKRRHRNRR